MITVRQVSKLHFIDIYWLYDDGGLTLLVPYILSQRKRWKNFQLRVFVIIDKMSNETVITEQNVSELLEKFRVEYYDIIVLELPEKSYYRRIEDIIESLSHDLCSSSSDTNELAISFQQYQDSTNKYVALRELLEEHSKYSQLIVMTIEIPRKDNLSAHIFMYWLDMLSIEMPEFLFIRGNQTNCLTIYID
ncbi:bumetanide-sensitive sodium-(potassium)-chloride cotransporter-like [Oppia nitens]|uniref:bumetanide-sensitive sodium-(potassium)-chloride cotransporter-like n=1 Tax=Oppia nitens TaxID=1686743 RepID=UPI0023DB0A5E|nr:bumetanide-sensitive sodium-(potassium)-chloride cotransporter-like [Oppia nitens]